MKNLDHTFTKGKNIKHTAFFKNVFVTLTSADRNDHLCRGIVNGNIQRCAEKINCHN